MNEQEFLSLVNTLFSAIGTGALICIAFQLASKHLTGPQGEQGPQGIQGEPGPAGHIHVSPSHNGTPSGTLFEMLNDGLTTGHLVREGSKDYAEALNTPGLSLKASDGTVIEGVQ